MGITVAVIVSLSGSFYAYLAYRSAAAARTPISRYATGLVRINMHALYRSMLPEYLGRKRKSRASLLEGLEIPSDIFFYTVKDKHNTTVFGSLKIADPDAFAQTVAGWGLILLGNNISESPKLAANASRTLTVAYNNKQVVLAFSLERENVQPVLLDIVRGNNIIPVKESPFKDILKEDGHVVFLSDAGEAVVNFCKGAVKADMSLQLPGLIIPDHVQRHIPAEQQPMISLWLYTKGAQWLQDVRIGDIQLNKDSLSNFHLQGMEIMISGSVIQRDSVITYEYNDDFEKVPVVTVQENSVPGMKALISCNSRGLYGYLQRLDIIEPDSNRVNRKVFPLFQLYAHPGDTFLQVATLREATHPGKIESTPEFFGMKIDFKQLAKQKDFSFLSSYIRKLDSLDAGATKCGDGTVALRAELLFKEKGSNAIWQVMESL